MSIKVKPFLDDITNLDRYYVETTLEHNLNAFKTAYRMHVCQ